MLQEPVWPEVSQLLFCSIPKPTGCYVFGQSLEQIDHMEQLKYLQHINRNTLQPKKKKEVVGS